MSDGGGADIRLEHVYRIYRVADTGVAALGGVTFEVARGEFVALMGPSGAGKSTILNLIGGLDRPTAGTVTVGDRDLGRLEDDELAAYRRVGVGFVWQGTARNLVPYLSVRQNAELPLLAGSRSATIRHRRVDDLLELVGLADRARHLPAMLSGGEQQRAAVAVALANHPWVVVADEPTGELDSASADRVLGAFQDAIRELGTTVVMATHDPAAAGRADRVLRLLDGRIREGSHPERLDDRGRLSLPREALLALGSPFVEVEVSAGEIHIRPRRGHHG